MITDLSNSGKIWEVLLKLLPPEVLENKDTVAHEIIRASIIRGNFIPGIRHRLGWYGVNEVSPLSGISGALTSKIKGMEGIYGLVPVESKANQAKFSLFYFPAPDEEIIENFSVAAGIFALKKDFISLVREFPKYPDMSELFHIGFIDARLDLKNGFFLSLTASKRSETISIDGIKIKSGEDEVMLVPEMGIDQSLPSFDLAMPFFRTLASSFTFHLKAPPEYLKFCSEELLKGEITKEPCDNIVLGYRCDGKVFCDTSKDNIYKWRKGEKLLKFNNEPWWKTDYDFFVKEKGKVPSLEKPRFIILSGFLGSGKTTFLDSFIQEQTQDNRFVAVIQNEIGEKGLDKKLLKESHAVIEMDEGCVCCTLSGNLRAAISDIMKNYYPDFVVLETTGAANPANVFEELSELSDLVEFCSITTVVDANAAEKTLKDFEVARSQIRLADNILLNKCDLNEESDIDTVEQTLRALNPAAEIYRTIGGEIKASELYGVNFRDKNKRPVFLNPGEILGTHIDDKIETFMIETKDSIEKDKLIGKIKDAGPDILRVKGIADFSEFDEPCIFQYTPGIVSIEPYEDMADGDRYLIIIGRNINRLKEEFRQFSNFTFSTTV